MGSNRRIQKSGDDNEGRVPVKRAGWRGGRGQEGKRQEKQKFESRILPSNDKT